MKPVYFKNNSYIDFKKEVNDKDPKFKVRDHVRISKCKNICYYYAIKIRVKFNGSILRQPKISYTHLNIVNIYIAYELGASSSHNNDPTLKNSLFGAVTLNKNADIDKYGYSGYGIGFHRRSSFSFPGGGFGQNVLIFLLLVLVIRKKDILVLGKGPRQGLKHTLTSEKMYSINFAVTKRSFV